MKMAEEMGWTGNITDDMIRRELQNEAVSTLSTKVRQLSRKLRVQTAALRVLTRTLQVRMRTYRRVIEAWSKFSRVRRIAKGKHLESDRQYSRFVINRCFQAWRGKVLQKMEKWKIEVNMRGVPARSPGLLFLTNDVGHPRGGTSDGGSFGRLRDGRAAQADFVGAFGHGSGG